MTNAYRFEKFNIPCKDAEKAINRPEQKKVKLKIEALWLILSHLMQTFQIPSQLFTPKPYEKI